MKHFKKLFLLSLAVILLVSALPLVSAHAAGNYHRYNFHIGWGDSYYGDPAEVPSLQFEYPDYLQPKYHKGHSYTFTEENSGIPVLQLGWQGNADMYTAKGGEEVVINGIVGTLQTTGSAWDVVAYNGDGSWYTPGTYRGERFSFKTNDFWVTVGYQEKITDEIYTQEQFDNLSDDEFLTNRADWEHLLSTLRLVHNDLQTQEIDNILVDQAWPNGILIKSDISPVVYRMMDGTRQPFMNEELFYTWYDSFDSVEVMTATELAAIPMGSPVLPAPGSWIKIQSIPKVYMVDNDRTTIRWITSEEVAQRLRGDDWNQDIITVDVSLFGRFTVGKDRT